MKAVLGVIGKGGRPELADGPTGVPRWWRIGSTLDLRVDWMRKDLGLVLDEAKRNGARLPVTALVDQFYADIQAQGGNRTGHTPAWCADLR